MARIPSKMAVAQNTATSSILLEPGRGSWLCGLNNTTGSSMIFPPLVTASIWHPCFPMVTAVLATPCVTELRREEHPPSPPHSQWSVRLVLSRAHLVPRGWSGCATRSGRVGGVLMGRRQAWSAGTWQAGGRGYTKNARGGDRISSPSGPGERRWGVGTRGPFPPLDRERTSPQFRHGAVRAAGARILGREATQRRNATEIH
mmetsp:Transcript_11021/g.32656  ORF Transcript_11021/g.32656 Transcript_11021/m.32656 type:complete len:202 (-) Transcript_11021:1362-1967(-)